MNGQDSQKPTKESDKTGEVAVGEQPDVVEVEQGVANVISGTIYVHKDLKVKDPELYNYVMVHESAHLLYSKKPWADMAHDFAVVPATMFRRLLKFTLTTKGAWWQLLPFRKLYLPDKKDTYLMVDVATCLAYIIIAGAAGLILWAGKVL